MAYFQHGPEGFALDRQCSHCPIGRNPASLCPVLLVQSKFNYSQLDKGQGKLREAMTALVDDNGTCLMRKTLFKALALRDPDEPINVLPSMAEWAKQRGVNVV